MNTSSDPSPESFASKVAVGIIVETFKESLRGLKSFDSWMRKQTTDYDPLGIAADRYSERLEERYNSMRIFGMARPIPLRSVYVRVNILQKLTARYGLTVEELERAFDKDRRGFAPSIKTEDGFTVIDRLSKVMVLGKPGAGKSTFLKYLLLQALDGAFNEAWVPVFVSLKDWSDSGVSLLQFIADEFDVCGFPDAKGFIERLLAKGRCLILFDGFDEVTGEIERTVTSLRKFAEKYEENKIVISCRIAARDYVFEKFTEIEVSDFVDSQIKQFITNWFGSGTPKATLCWQQLKAEPPIRELASIPLLLTMLCVTFDEMMDFPQNRAELYKEAIDALLKKWDASRSIRRDEAYRYLSLKRKEDLLSRVAVRTFEADQYFIHQRTLETYVSEYIDHLPNLDTHASAPDCTAIVRAIEAQHGLLVERARKIYSFSHLTIQEYFTAKYIVENEARGCLNELVDNHLFTDSWWEVFLLASGMLSDATDFLLRIRAKLSEMAEQNGILPVIDGINNSIVERSKYPRGLALAIGAAMVLKNVPNEKKVEKTGVSTVRSEHALLLALQIAGALGYHPMIQTDPGVHILAVDRRGRSGAGNPIVANKVVELEPLVNLSKTLLNGNMLDAFTRYIKGSSLLLRCLETDCYVPKKVRADVLASLLHENYSQIEF